jgi:hypothetical protein
MRDETPQPFSDEEASRIWRRAAELQAARRLPPVRGEGHESGSDGSAPAPRGLSGEQVESIAREAGIEAEFVRRAIAERSLAGAMPQGVAEGMRAVRRVKAALEAVQAELQRVGAEEHFNLRLRDIRTEGEGRELVFDLAGPESMAGGAFRAGDFGAGRIIVGVRAVLLPVADAPDETEMLLFGAPNEGMERSLVHHDIGFGTLGGILGGSVAGAAGAELLALAGAAVLAPVGAGALVVGGLAIGAVRLLHRIARHKDAEAFERFADEVEGALRLRAHDIAPLPPRANRDVPPELPYLPPAPPTSSR